MPSTKCTSCLSSTSASKPKVSIITVCRNAESTIGCTINSVINQSYPNIEFLVIDGDSTDETLHVIEQAGDQIHRVVSEPDSGIYQAMNKGIRLATGDFLLFLNADDTLKCTQIIESVVEMIACLPRGDIYHGGVQWLDPVSGIFTPKPAISATDANLFRGSLNHQAMFIRRELFQQIGLYDEGFRLAGDYEWLLRALRAHRCRFRVMKLWVSVFRLGGLSTTIENKEQLLEECTRARSLHFGRWDAVRYRIWIRIRKVLGI